MNNEQQVKDLTEHNFQMFLTNNLNQIFVYMDNSYEYSYYFPLFVKITEASKGIGKWMRQM
jgi:hypothetical protein